MWPLKSRSERSPHEQHSQELIYSNMYWAYFCVLIVTVPLAERNSVGSIEMSTSVTFPVKVSFVRGCADTCIVHC